jgi:hypothetical protein
MHEYVTRAYLHVKSLLSSRGRRGNHVPVIVQANGSKLNCDTLTSSCARAVDISDGL